jgi:hypothetical protein
MDKTKDRQAEGHSDKITYFNMILFPKGAILLKTAIG